MFSFDSFWNTADRRCFEDASCKHETPRLIDGTSPEENRPLGPGLAHPAPQFLIRWRHVLSLHDPQSRTDFGRKFEMSRRSSATAEGACEALPPSWTNIFLQ